MERTRGRRAIGLANDERIRTAAISLLDEYGVDGFSVSDVVALAGLTTGAFYARYQDLDELLADLWEERMVSVVFDLAQQAALLRDSWPELDIDALARLLESTRERRIAFELMSVMARVDPLADVVPRTLMGILESSRLANPRDDVRDAIGVGLLALALGSAGHTRLDGALHDDAAEIVQWIKAGRGHTWSGPAPVSPGAQMMRFTPTPSPMQMTETELRRPRLLDAAVSVIARTGIRRANLRRISRASGYSHSAVYEEYDSSQELLIDLVKEVVLKSTQVSNDASRYTDPEAEGAWLSGILHPSGHTVRRLSFEFLLAANHDVAYRAVFADADQVLIEGVATLLAGRSTPGHVTIARYRYARRDLGFGLAVLEECVGGLAGVDWRPVVGTLLVGSLRRAGVSAKV